MIFIPAYEDQIGFVQRKLKCISCKDDMYDPAGNCFNGHYYCGKCNMRLTICPVCRIVLPRPNPPLGADIFRQSKQKVLGGFPQLKLLESMKQPCLLKAVDNCTWTGHPEEIVNHCLRWHYANTYEGPNIHLIYPRYQKGHLLREDDPDDSCYILIYVGSLIFRLEWHYQRREHLMDWCIYYLGNNAQHADRYYCEIVFQNIENPGEGEPIMMRCHTTAYYRSGENFNWGLVNPHVLRDLSGERGLYYSIYMGVLNPKEELKTITLARKIPSAPEECCNSFFIPQCSHIIEENPS